MPNELQLTRITARLVCFTASITHDDGPYVRVPVAIEELRMARVARSFPSTRFIPDISYANSYSVKDSGTHGTPNRGKERNQYFKESVTSLG